MTYRLKTYLRCPYSRSPPIAGAADPGHGEGPLYDWVPMERTRRPRRHLVAVLLVLPAVALLFGWTALADSSPSPAASGAPAAAGAAPAGDVAKGMTVYNQNCTACHGANLEGGIGPKLNPLEKLPGTVPDPKDPAYLTDVIANGLNGKGSYGQMPAWKGKLSDADIQNVIAYVLDAAKQGGGGISPAELARSNVLWVTVGTGLMLVLTFLLARYNMRWIGRRAAARSGRR